MTRKICDEEKCVTSLEEVEFIIPKVVNFKVENKQKELEKAHDIN